MPIFRVDSVKNLHRPEKFTLTASATIIWYAVNIKDCNVTVRFKIAKNVLSERLILEIC